MKWHFRGSLWGNQIKVGEKLLLRWNMQGCEAGFNLQLTAACYMQALSGPESERDKRLASAVVSVQRHALDEHVPALSGPLNVTCAEGSTGSFLEWTQEEDEAVSLCAIWYACCACLLLSLRVLTSETHCEASLQCDECVLHVGKFFFCFYFPRFSGVAYIATLFLQTWVYGCECRFGGAATVLVTASAAGLLGAHLLAEDIRPVWAESAPLCLTDNVLLLGVRSEVRCRKRHLCTPPHHAAERAEFAARGMCPFVTSTHALSRR